MKMSIIVKQTEVLMIPKPDQPDIQEEEDDTAGTVKPGGPPVL